MGIRTEQTRIDDLTGEPGEGIKEFTFVMDGIEYTMDACISTRDEFRKRVQDFTAVARARVLGPGANANEIREWAKEEGYHIHDNGRLPDRVIEAYRRAHP